jgi:hypothetical protein
MTASDRSSNRVVDLRASDLASGSHAANKGADGGGLLASNQKARIGRRGLAEVKTSLSDRDWRVLHSLEQLHFLTTRQVQRLHYPPGSFTALSAPRSARRDLGRLHDLRLVSHLERRIGGLRAGSASLVWTLDGLGARLLDHGTRRRSHEPSRLHLEHVLDVAELVVQLQEAARSGVAEVLELETEPDCWRIMPAAHGGRRTLKPDLRLVLGAQERELHWFVELDRGSEHRPVLARKCQAYLAAWQAGREQAEHGVFPRVLWIVPDTARVQVIQSVFHNMPTVSTGMFMATTPDVALTALLGEGSAP